jgi:hypothetical protein
MIKKDGHDFLEELAGFPPHSFENIFSTTAGRLGLGRALKRNELRLLCRAAFLAALCNIAMNRLGGCGARVHPEREANRTRLEIEFMAARDRFYATPGWRNLPAAQRGMIQRVFLRVQVRPENLAS